MSDVFTKAKRSEIMSRVKGHGNKRTELAFIALLRKHHMVGWRRHQPLFGKPDFVFHNPRLAVFVDGCFWHGCPIHSQLPRTNRPFWAEKLSANKARDRKVNRTLRRQRWRVLRIWQHDLVGNSAACLPRLRRMLSQQFVRFPAAHTRRASQKHSARFTAETYAT